MTGSTGKKLAVILNGISLRKKVFQERILPRLQVLHHVEVFKTLSKNDGILLARKAAERFSFDAILAAGGDGTLHQVVNGVLQACAGEPKITPIGLIPLGSGNDFAKTAGITADPRQLLTLLENFKPVGINAGEIFYTGLSGEKLKQFFVNVADIGMGPLVVQRVLDSGRSLGPAVAYYKSIIQTFLSYKPVEVTAKTSTWEWSGKLRSLAVANGKFYGHGLCIAPDAKADDDMFSVFICGNVSVFDFIRHSAKMKACKKVVMSEVKYLEATEIDLTSREHCLLEGDGEILGKLPATIRLLPRKIPMLISGI